MFNSNFRTKFLYISIKKEIMAKKVNENWEQVVSTTYEVCDDQMGRGKNFVDTLAKALDTSGDFQVSHLLS